MWRATRKDCHGVGARDGILTRRGILTADPYGFTADYAPMSGAYTALVARKLPQAHLDGDDVGWVATECRVASAL